jgi:transposase-like protein
MFNNLRELIASMPDEKTCREYLVKKRWNGNITCPYCGFGKVYVIEGGKRFKCADRNNCAKKFSVQTKTFFEASNLPLTKWLPAIYFITANKKGISSYQLAKHIGTSQKSAWFMLHRIREALNGNTNVTLGKNDFVEADMTFVGGKIANMTNSKRKKVAENRDNSFNKTTVLGITERKGDTVLMALPKTYGNLIDATIKQKVEFAAQVVTDEGPEFLRLRESFHHTTVNHGQGEFSRLQFNTNSIEGVFSHFKRMVIGTYHQLSRKHLQAYCNEFSYRFNTRKLKDANRFELTLKNLEHRLTYKQLVYGEGKKETDQSRGEIQD